MAKCWRWTRRFLRLFFTTTSVLLVCGLSTCTQVKASSRNHLQELLARYRQDSRVNERREASKDLAESNKEMARWSNPNSSRASHDAPALKPSVSSHNRFNAVQSYEDFYHIFHGTKERGQTHARQLQDSSTDTRTAAQGIPQDLEGVRQANEHYLYIRNTTRCQNPRAKVVRVQEYYPDPTKVYLPRCTILHRCGEDSGCCDSGNSVCAPRASQEVVLYFYTFTLGGSSRGYSNSVEKLLFENHTECECRPINNMPRIKVDPEQREMPKRCPECPSPFNQRIFDDGRCSCDCFDKQRRCLRIKRGRDPMPERERRCVQAGYCHVPDCEHGLYDAVSGRCPKRFDESETTRQSDQLDYSLPSHRWSFFERD